MFKSIYKSFFLYFFASRHWFSFPFSFYLLCPCTGLHTFVNIIFNKKQVFDIKPTRGKLFTENLKAFKADESLSSIKSKFVFFQALVNFNLFYVSLFLKERKLPPLNRNDTFGFNMLFHLFILLSLVRASFQYLPRFELFF